MKRYSEKWRQMPFQMKLVFIISILLTLSLIYFIPKTYSWFSRLKRTAILAPVDAPQELYIAAGNSEDSAFINLSGIDVQDDVDNPTFCKDYVFCVKGSADIDGYYIQLAHTTNIQFDYSIYKAKQYEDDKEAEREFNKSGLTLLSKNLPVATYVSKIDKEDDEITNKTYYYPKLAELPGEYINLKTVREDNRDVALGMKSDDVSGSMKSVHDKTYGEYDNVQKNAEPLYWHSELVDLLALDEDDNPTIDTMLTPEKDAGEFTRYYILHIDWEGKGLKNNKETDMVYITVATSNSVTSNNS